MYEEEIHFGKLLIKQSETVLAHLTLVTLTFDSVNPKINKVQLLPRMDVWTKFEEGRPSFSCAIDRKRKGYRWTKLQID